ncbi:hypothetical protein D3C76_1238100 [compost metagenome]
MIEAQGVGPGAIGDAVVQAIATAVVCAVLACGVAGHLYEVVALQGAVEAQAQAQTLAPGLVAATVVEGAAQVPAAAGLPGYDDDPGCPFATAG